MLFTPIPLPHQTAHVLGCFWPILDLILGPLHPIYYPQHHPWCLSQNLGFFVVVPLAGTPLCALRRYTKIVIIRHPYSLVNPTPIHLLPVFLDTGRYSLHTRLPMRASRYQDILSTIQEALAACTICTYAPRLYHHGTWACPARLA